MQLLGCFNPRCGYQLSKAHLQLIDQPNWKVVLVEGRCPECGTHIGPVSLPLPFWNNLPEEDVYQYLRQGEITADELIDFHEQLENLTDLSTFIPVKAKDPRWLELAREVWVQNPDHPFRAEVLAAVREWLDEESVQALCREATEALVWEMEEAAERVSSPLALLSRVSMGWGRRRRTNAQRRREQVRLRLHRMLLLGVFVGLGLSGRWEGLMERWERFQKGEDP